jgi:phage shock protein PspC (stress-responsive transcriptional regulator)
MQNQVGVPGLSASGEFQMMLRFGRRRGRLELMDNKRLTRSKTDRMVAGVAGGIANYMSVDPVIVRILFVALAIFGGGGIILYLACWLLMPEES